MPIEAGEGPGPGTAWSLLESPRNRPKGAAGLETPHRTAPTAKQPASQRLDCGNHGVGTLGLEVRTYE